MGRGPIWMPIAATLCALAIGGTAWVTRSQSEVRERLARFVAAEEGERAAPPPRREAVHCETLEGDAIDDYEAASAVLAAIPLRWRHVDNGKRTELTEAGRPLTAEARRALQPSLDRALQSIRTGVRRATALPRKSNVDTAALEAVVDDAVECAFATRDARTLAELFVDRWVLRGDVGHLWIRPPEFRDEWLPVLDAGSAVWLSAALQCLDERQPRFASPVPWIAHHVREVAELTPLQQSFGQGLRAWRWGFDSYWRELVACDRLVSALPELEPPALDLARRKRQVSAFAASLRELDGGHAINFPEFLVSHEAQLRRAVTRLRLLRLCVAFVHGRELPRLDDPFGSGPIEVDVRGDAATFRSEGMYGKKRLERTVRRR